MAKMVNFMSVLPPPQKKKGNTTVAANDRTELIAFFFTIFSVKIIAVSNKQLKCNSHVYAFKVL